MTTFLARPVRRLLSGDDHGQADYVRQMREPGDAGLFGPASATWQVLSYPATLLAGVRALLLQTLDPMTVAGVARHSRFRSEPVERLQMTARFVTIAAFASREAVERECATIRSVHARVAGTTEDGRSYSANDPIQLRFVHMALIDSLLVAHQLCAPQPLCAAQADRFVVEWNALAPLLGFDSVELPTSRADLDRMLRQSAERFEVGKNAMEAFEFLAAPPLQPLLKPGYAMLLTAAAGSLPDYARRMLPRVLANPSPLRARVTAIVLIRFLARLLGPSPAWQAAEFRLSKEH